MRAVNDDDGIIEGMDARHHERFEELVKLCRTIFRKLDPTHYAEFNEILEFEDWAWRHLNDKSPKKAEKTTSSQKPKLAKTVSFAAD